MTDIAIRVENLSKRYRIGQYVGSGAQYRTLRESLTDAVFAPIRRLKSISKFEIRNSKSDTPQSNDSPSPVPGQPSTDGFIWALKDVSFEVKRGEVLGIIGRNGAGKSTLLKVLTGITEPTEGRAKLKGRVSSLLEVGTGFHPELTGRENVRLSGAILGMTRKEINRKFDEIVHFSGVETYIDTPVKRYSSGMRVRLGFAVAAHLEPEILLIDEVLAVGDYKFQKKCLGKMQEVTGQGRTVLFVSHNMRAISQICHRTILLNDGGIEIDGDTANVIREYTGGGQGTTAEITWPAEKAPGNQSVRLLGVHVRDKDDKVKSEFQYTEPINICVTFLVLDDMVDLYLNMYLENEDGVFVLVAKSVNNNPRFKKGIHEAQYTIAPHFLNEGRYFVGQFLFKERAVTSPENIAHVKYPVGFGVSYSGKFSGGQLTKYPGVVRPDWDWQISEIDRN